MVPVASPARVHPAVVKAVAVDAVHAFSTQVCAPVAAAAESVYPAPQAEQSTASDSQRVPAVPVATVGVPFGQVHVLATQVCDPAAAAVAESVYPAPQAEQSSPATSQRVPAVPVATVAVPPVHVHVLATQVCDPAAAAVAEMV